MSTIEWISIVVSVVMLVGTAIAIPRVIQRLPVDYFVRPPPPRSLAAVIGRNVMGFLLILLGIAMLVLPGQGILTILVGLALVDLPIKHRIIQRLLTHSSVAYGLCLLREKLG